VGFHTIMNNELSMLEEMINEEKEEETNDEE
jgi:hypothetical protein